MEVIVYTQPGCHSCQQEKAWLLHHQIAFEERDIRKNPAWIDEVIALGSDATPTTVIRTQEGTEQIVVGFRTEDLRRYLLKP
ncbi:glutaredoxin family protein [Sulfobacillus sp. hq2]|uniref:glutaredoxin family protein n=1 Tax=Sulfobacillus TaxID=28033 RepID=UPI000CD2C1C6|nr:glutaredoxin family protein [Sulfobacillus sp. hq2]POB12106.1 NrdH-redoxin [Sulfobacillus sp. hq2]